MSPGNRKLHRLLPAGLLRMLVFGTVSGIALAADVRLLQDLPLTAESLMQWRLPSRLNEISGLAMTADARLLAVNDEVAIVYEIDYDDGRLVKAFALGNPALKADIEGIAVADRLVYLLTSNGRIYLSAEGADGQRVSYDVFNTGLSDQCEFEGLATSRDESRLLLLCKDLKKNAEIDDLAIFVWSIEDRELQREETIVLPMRDILRSIRNDKLHPSGIAIDRNSGHLLIIAARQHALVELAADGAFVDARRLPLKSRHRQAEGIELASDGRLLLADEGGSHKARLAVYHRQGVVVTGNAATDATAKDE